MLSGRGQKEPSERSSPRGPERVETLEVTQPPGCGSSGVQVPKSWALVPFDGLVGWRSQENHGSGLILTRARLQKSRSRFGGGGPNSRDFPALEMQGPGLGRGYLASRTRGARALTDSASRRRPLREQRKARAGNRARSPGTVLPLRGPCVDSGSGSGSASGGHIAALSGRASASQPHPPPWREAETRCAEEEKVELD